MQSVLPCYVYRYFPFSFIVVSFSCERHFLIISVIVLNIQKTPAFLLRMAFPSTVLSLYDWLPVPHKGVVAVLTFSRLPVSRHRNKVEKSGHI